jgi:predicted nucleotidyltransferase
MDPKSLSADFRDFLKSLNDHGVEYLLVGGHAVAYHGYVRPTQDLDVWIGASQNNAQQASLRDGFSMPNKSHVSASGPI